MKLSEFLIGAHCSIQGGVHKAIEIGDRLGFTAIQMFTKNSNQWNAKKIEDEEVDRFSDKLKHSKIEFIIAHDSYLINLCGLTDELLQKSRKAFVDEILRCNQLGIKYLNFHPGAHGGRGELEGINYIAESINIAHEETAEAEVFSTLETTAGQGTAIGYKFEHLRDIIDKVKDKNRLKVCIDTAHIFAAGYNIKDSEEFEKVFDDFDRIVGLEKLVCFHINDSKKELGSKVDRHENIGKGFIGLDGFSNLMNHDKLKSIPKVLETPKGKEQLEDLENIKILLSLIKK